jgi:hypothetical protein
VSWGTTDQSPQHLGPVIIMEYITGTSLATLMKRPTASEPNEMILATDIDEVKLDYVYEQLADYLLQLSHLTFDAIGAVSKDDAADTWLVKDRPLTYNMNELASVVSNYPIHTFPTTPFHTTQSYLEHLATENLTHLQTQRNIASTREDAKQRFIARHRMQALVPRYSSPDDNDATPFTLFCDDLQPSNMLADPSTWRITAELDWESTNSMPSQFSYDAPWWQLLLGPDMWLEHHSIEEFVERYEPRLEQFLGAMRRAEERRGKGGSMAEKMRKSWETGRFWFDCGVRKS